MTKIRYKNLWFMLLILTLGGGGEGDHFKVRAVVFRQSKVVKYLQIHFNIFMKQFSYMSPISLINQYNVSKAHLEVKN